MNATHRIAIAATLLAALAACGNKGPLLQADAPKAAPAEPAVLPAPAATQQGDTPPGEPAATGESTPPIATPAADASVPVQEDDPAPAQDNGTP